MQRCLRLLLAMIQPPAALRIARMLCALLVVCSLALFSASCAAAKAQASIPTTFLCDSSNSNPGNPNTCWSVFNARTPKYLRVMGSVGMCPVSTECWSKTAVPACKVIPATGPVRPTPELPNC